MKKKLDVSKEVTKIWQEAKNNLKELGQRTLKLAQKGEKEVVRASRIGRHQLDIVSLNLKKENLFRQVGKRAYEMNLKKGEVAGEKLASLFAQINKINQQIRGKKGKIGKLRKD